MAMNEDEPWAAFVEVVITVIVSEMVVVVVGTGIHPLTYSWLNRSVNPRSGFTFFI